MSNESTATIPGIDWQEWLRRWDVQQTGYLPDREARFTAMLDVLEALLPPNFVALDLACGPGSLSQRLLARFPAARAIALDLDPVLLAMGRATLGSMDGRLRWVDADLKEPDWAAALGEIQVDAVLSTTALHWLPAPVLVQLYRQLGLLVREDGVFLNGDNIAFGPALPAFGRLSQWRKDHLWADERFAAAGIETFREWWDALTREPALADLAAERERRFGWMNGINTQWSQPIVDVHIAALRDAGFRQVDTVWQQVNNRVLLAVR